MSTIEVLFFGELADLAGADHKKYDCVPDSDQLLQLILQEFPFFKTKNYQIAVNEQLIHSNTVLKANDVVALLPPFSGG